MIVSLTKVLAALFIVLSGVFFISAAQAGMVNDLIVMTKDAENQEGQKGSGGGYEPQPR